MSDIFSTLSRYGFTSEENYLTEAFVYLVKTLLERQEEAGLTFLKHICGLPILISNAQEIRLTTQVTFGSGRPDIEIRIANNIVVFVEVKHDSPLGIEQLERYKKELDGLSISGMRHTRLVFLSRSLEAAKCTTLAPSEYHQICWYHVHDWLFDLGITDEVCEYLIRDFLTFLNRKKMNVNKVTWEYIEGVPAFINLTNMIEVAISEIRPKLKLRRTAGWSWRGYYLKGTLWCGVRYDKPLTIVFEDGQGNGPSYQKTLDLNQIHFFSLSQGEQLECIIKFVQEAWAEAPKE